MRLTIIIVALTCLISGWSLNAQSLTESPYLTALTFIQNSQDVQDNLKRVFCKKRAQLECLGYNIQDKTDLLPIHFFSAAYRLIRLPQNVVKSPDLYKERFKDTPNVRLSSNTYAHKKSPLRLTLSPLIENFLVAEFLIDSFNISSVKMGPALLVLIIFNDEGEVKDVYFASPMYN